MGGAVHWERSGCNSGGELNILRRFVLGSTSGAPSGLTAVIDRRFLRRLKSFSTDCGTKTRSIPWIIPSGRVIVSGWITLALPTIFSPDTLLVKLR